MNNRKRNSGARVKQIPLSLPFPLSLSLSLSLSSSCIPSPNPTPAHRQSHIYSHRNTDVSHVTHRGDGLAQTGPARSASCGPCPTQMVAVTHLSPYITLEHTRFSRTRGHTPGSVPSAAPRPADPQSHTVSSGTHLSHGCGSRWALWSPAALRVSLRPESWGGHLETSAGGGGSKG